MSDSTKFEGTAQITITLDGVTDTFPLSTDTETILNAAIDNGIDAPYSCKGGVCTTCKAKLTEGAVHMRANYALTEKELKAGYILVCQSEPTTEKVSLTWDI
jgi:ring-1,2-phenylacetyl-CoA epoxidase subunit PaaE